jgi:hypothetical protein
MTLSWAKSKDECAPLIGYQTLDDSPKEPVCNPTLVGDTFFTRLKLIINSRIARPFPSLHQGLLSAFRNSTRSSFSCAVSTIGYRIASPRLYNSTSTASARLATLPS